MTLAASGDPGAVVAAFLSALGDVELAAVYLADDLVYENIGGFALPTIHGGEQARRILDRCFRLLRCGFRVDIHRVCIDGQFVMTERTDAFVWGAVEASFWVCGVFEVRDGRIVAWRDYFDIVDVARGFARAAGRALVRRATRVATRRDPSW